MVQQQHLQVLDLAEVVVEELELVQQVVPAGMHVEELELVLLVVPAGMQLMKLM